MAGIVSSVLPFYLLPLMVKCANINYLLHLKCSVFPTTFIPVYKEQLLFSGVNDAVPPW